MILCLSYGDNSTYLAPGRGTFLTAKTKQHGLGFGPLRSQQGDRVLHGRVSLRQEPRHPLFSKLLRHPSTCSHRPSFHLGEIT